MIVGMKRIAAAATALSVYLSSISSAFAQDRNILNVNIGTPRVGGKNVGIGSDVTIAQLISNALAIIYIVAALAVLFMLVVGAFQWITSGGDKENVEKARKRITSALIGLAILALALFITIVVGQVLNINLLELGSLPTLNQKP